MTAVDPNLLARLKAMKSDRTPWEDHWKTIERRVSPRGEQFSKQQAGSRRTEYQFDSTAVIALERFAAAMVSLIAPRQQMWHKLKPRDARLAKSLPVQRYLEQVNDALWDYRYSSAAAFQTQLTEMMWQLGALGTAPMLVEDRNGRGLIYRALHISTAWIDTDANGMVDTLARDIDYTARQAIEAFGAENLPKSVRDAETAQPGRTFSFTHFVTPRTARDPQRLDNRNLPIGSWYWLNGEDGRLVAESGFHSFPVPTVRYSTAPGEKYGRSVAMMALPDILMINEMAKSILRATHKALEPPLLLPDDGVMGSRMQTKPGALNYGGVNARGEQLVKPLLTGGSFPAAMEMREVAKQAINDAALVTLFQTLAQGSDRMTATEVLERLREKGVLLAPAASRIEAELLEPLLEREIDVLHRNGELPDPPEEFVKSGGLLKIEFDTPMTRAAKMEQPMAFFRTVEALTPLAAIDASVMDGLKLAEAARDVAETLGVPAKWRRDDDEIAQVQQRRDEERQAMQLVNSLPKVAGAQLDLARAAEAGGGRAAAA